MPKVKTIRRSRSSTGRILSIGGERRRSRMTKLGHVLTTIHIWSAAVLPSIKSKASLCGLINISGQRSLIRYIFFLYWPCVDEGVDLDLPEARVERSGLAITASQSLLVISKLTCHGHSFLNTLSHACRLMPFLPRVSPLSVIHTLANRHTVPCQSNSKPIMPTPAKCKDNHNHFFQH